MCECGGELVECVCGDRCCDDCGCRNADEHFPWSYTEFGVESICGESMDRNEHRPTVGAAVSGSRETGEQA